MMRKAFAFLLAAVLVLSVSACAQPEHENTQPGTQPQPTEPVSTEPQEVAASGTARLMIEGMEWGPVVSKVILRLDQVVSAASVSSTSFRVQIPRANYNGITAEEAEQDSGITVRSTVVIDEAYTCDETGSPSGDSSFVALDLYYTPDTPVPLLQSEAVGGKTFCDYYDMMITLTDSAALETAEGALITSLSIQPRIDMAETLFPQLEGVFLDGSFTGSDGITLTYASYAPAADGESHPLVIWLHGGGEGGTDVRSAIYGNEVTALFGEEFQEVLGGAYVLIPQSPTMWMAREENGVGSLYRETLMELIQDYVNQTSGIDTNRIYVGGCSNGGFMTMDLILNYPDYFAAAYPICGAYNDDNITDDQLVAIKHVPMWFIHAENDPVVNKEGFLGTAERLRDLGGDVHISLFEDVHDTSGRYADPGGGPYQYIGHWSWIWFFNNECEADGVNMWQWLAQQSK